ncbi:hypothetical protein NX059_012357 [Plenodomus lindquistii]|nr:hypothetical protein NX059_012357 [Plenodomus lindquistii]
MDLRAEAAVAAINSSRNAEHSTSKATSDDGCSRFMTPKLTQDLAWATDETLTYIQ